MSAGRQSRRKAYKSRRPLALVPGAVEFKFFDTAVSSLIDSTLEIPATGQWALIPQGDTQSTRDGRYATIKSIHFRGALTGTAGATSESAVFIWLVQDKQANGAAAAATAVMTGTSAESCHRNLNNNRRFKILHKEVIAPNKVGFQMDAGGAAENIYWPVEFYVPCDILMDWNSTTGAITEITQNNIFILAGAAGGNSDDNYTLSGNARVRFVG